MDQHTYFKRIHEFKYPLFAINRWLDKLTTEHAATLNADQMRYLREVDSYADKVLEQIPQLAQLEEMSEKKNAFEHEIGGPLGLLVAWPQVLLSEMYGPLSPDQRYYLSAIEGAARYLIALKDDARRELER
ncbi:MAG: hypothetical protein GYB64_20710 [Chloroflexi bacterium]|nr:hypothetical protein [Chloroflexota bacterium]